MGFGRRWGRAAVGFGQRGRAAYADLVVVSPVALVLGAEQEDFAPLGTDLLPWLVLALGAAMVFGNVVALVKPPEVSRAGELRRAPLLRSVVMIAVGFLGGIWAAASLLVG